MGLGRSELVHSLRPAWMLRPSGLIKMEEITSALKVENVSGKPIWIIDVNHCHIVLHNTLSYLTLTID